MKIKQPPGTTIVELDERGRCRLPKPPEPYTHYLGSRYEDGTIILEPCRVASEPHLRAVGEEQTQ